METVPSHRWLPDSIQMAGKTVLELEWQGVISWTRQRHFFREIGEGRIVRVHEDIVTGSVKAVLVFASANQCLYYFFLWQGTSQSDT